MPLAQLLSCWAFPVSPKASRLTVMLLLAQLWGFLNPGRICGAVLTNSMWKPGLLL